MRIGPDTAVGARCRADHDHSRPGLGTLELLVHIGVLARSLGGRVGLPAGTDHR